MPSTTSITSEIINKYPQFIFEKSDNFYWSLPENTIYYNPSDINSLGLLLHELSHALLDHKDYTNDVQLISLERQAWDHAIILGKSFKVTITDELVQSNLNTYRDWLHSRSTCPKCTATGTQVKKDIYSCLACNNQWKVNSAKDCRLQRRNLNN